jgi:N-methylhydantoinase A/oxoprolinase/acetone carboxylase beta subunit
MERLGPGATLQGPAIVEDAMSTLVLGVRAQAQVDARGWLLVNLDGS